MTSKKDEQIALYIAALTTRDPSKRQIKPVSIESFQLFEDLESESDQSFVLNPEDESDENEEAKENETDDNDEDKESEESRDNESEKDDKSDVISAVTDVVVNLGLRCSDSQISDVPNVTKCKLDTVMICMMCLLDVTYSDNEIIECDGCGVVVHEDCYKICDNVFMSCDNSDSSTDPWFCDACLNNVREPRCELCPVEGGVFKRTENNCWVHLQCALYTPGVAFNDVDCLTEITLSELPLKEWSGRECCICTNPFYAKTGVCISCDAGLCKNFFHVLCAQKEGLLSEPNHEENPDDPYFAQCQQHTDKETAKRRRKNYFAALNRQKLRLEAWKNNNHFSDTRMLRKLEYFSSLYHRVRELAPVPFVPLTKVPRYLETNPVSVFLFKKKATNLRLSQEVINSHTSASDSRAVNGVPVFSPDFISYFLDREKKIDDMSKEIVRLESFQRDMHISEQNTSHQFNKIMAKKEATLTEYSTDWERLSRITSIMKELSTSPELSEVLDDIIAKFPATGTDSVHGRDSPETGDNREAGNDGATLTSHHNGVRRRDSTAVINECCKCKGLSDQHLMIDCDDCFKYFHLSCLEPPLLRMPRKTKLYGWQCSSCGVLSSEESRREKVDVNCPRQLRKLEDVTSRYKRSESRSSSIAATNKLIQNSINIANKCSKQRLFKKPFVLVDDVIKTMESRSNIGDGASSSIDRGNDNLDEVVSIDDVVNGPEQETIDGPSDVPAMNDQPMNGPEQRRSHRSKKKPITLLDEFEGPTFAKRRRYSKVVRRTSTDIQISPDIRKSTETCKTIRIRKSSVLKKRSHTRKPSLIENSPLIRKSSVRKSSIRNKSQSKRKLSLTNNSLTIRKASTSNNCSPARKSMIIRNSPSVRKSLLSNDSPARKSLIIRNSPSVEKSLLSNDSPARKSLIISNSPSVKKSVPTDDSPARKSMIIRNSPSVRKSLLKNDSLARKSLTTRNSPSVKKSLQSNDTPARKSLISRNSASVRKSLLSNDYPSLNKKYSSSRKSLVIKNSSSDKQASFRNNSPSIEPFLIKNSPSIEQLSLSNNSPSIEQPSLTNNSPSIEQPSLTNNSPSIEQPSLSNNSPSIEQPFLSYNSPSIDQPSLCNVSTPVKKSSPIHNSLCNHPATTREPSKRKKFSSKRQILATTESPSNRKPSQIRKSKSVKRSFGSLKSPRIKNDLRIHLTALPDNKKRRIWTLNRDIEVKIETEEPRSIHSNEELDQKPHRQPITFFPCSEKLDDNKQPQEYEDEVQIGVVAKKPSIGPREMVLIGTFKPKMVEKKPVLIKWHGDQDDNCSERIVMGSSGSSTDSNRHSM